MIDMLPPGPMADLLLRSAYLAIDDRANTLEALIVIVGIGGEQAAARIAFDLVMPLGQERQLDTPEGRYALMVRADAILSAFSNPWPSLVTH